MTTSYVPTVTTEANNGFSLQFSDTNYSATLTSGGGDTTLTVPGGGGLSASPSTNRGYVAYIKSESDKNVWMALNGTAAVPVGATFAASTSQLIGDKEGKFVRAGDVLHFITVETTADISVSFYAII